MAKKKLLPLGFRFTPMDEELVMYYLKRKVTGEKHHIDVISELDIYKFAPWELPEKSSLRSGVRKWYFFCAREKKYVSGGRKNRSTKCGFWKTTGVDRKVHYDGRVVGMIKTLVFHKGRAPNGDRTNWVMYEYRLQDSDLASKGVDQDNYVLCEVFEKSGPGPRNGEQYGVPFREEEWDDDVDIESTEALTIAGLFIPPPAQASSQSTSIATSENLFLQDPAEDDGMLSVLEVPEIADSEDLTGKDSIVGLTKPAPSQANNVVLPVPAEDGMVSVSEAPHVPCGEYSDLVSLLDLITPLPDGNDKNEDCFTNEETAEAAPYLDGYDNIFDGLQNLDTLASINLSVNEPFFELKDLECPLVNPGGNVDVGGYGLGQSFPLLREGSREFGNHGLLDSFQLDESLAVDASYGLDAPFHPSKRMKRG